jgi:hypothetical protein
MSNKNKIGLIFLSVLIFLIIMLGYNFLSKLGYKVGGTRGFSKTIEESKKKGVFVKELDYKIIPDTLDVLYKPTFFLERGFLYGKSSVKQVLNLDEKEDKYQLRREGATNFLEKKYIYYAKKTMFKNIPDTIKYDIILSKDYLIKKKVKIGKLILFDKDK